jgi:hypothetical protein
MPSIVEELQRGAMDRNTPVSDLLRMAKVISVKLNLPDLAQWVDYELNGYGTTEVPTYRILKGQLKGKNPFHGWQPVLFHDENVENHFTNHPIGQPVAQMEHMLSRVVGGSGAMIPLSGQAAAFVMEVTRVSLPFAIIFSSSQAWGIVDAVRTSLLDWSLKLEKAGIRGEGVSFSNEEQERAHGDGSTYHIGSIGNFTGNLGANSGTVNATFQQGSAREVLKLVEKIKANEKELNLANAETARLKAALNELTFEMNQSAPNQTKVRQAVSSIRNVAEGAVGSLAATGILFELSKLFS